MMDARGVSTALVCLMSLALGAAQDLQARGRDAALQGRGALRAVLWLVPFGAWEQRFERTTIGADKVVDRHDPAPFRCSTQHRATLAMSVPDRETRHTRCHSPQRATGISSELAMILGPSALGMMSKSKISVGSQTVAQTLGMSTMPLM